jgi:hypothetical protein
MRNTAMWILIGASWAMLAGCEQDDSLSTPATGLPSGETPRASPEVQIGRSDSVDPGEPATPAVPDRQPVPATPPAGGADSGAAPGSAEVPPAN